MSHDPQHTSIQLQPSYQITPKTKTATHITLHLETNGITRDDGTSSSFDVTVSYDPDYLRLSRSTKVIEANNLPKVFIKTTRGENSSNGYSYTVEEALALRNALDVFLKTENYL